MVDIDIETFQYYHNQGTVRSTYYCECKHNALALKPKITFKRRLEDGGRFEGEEQLLSVLAECATLVSGHDELTNEASPISYVVVLIILGQVQNILRQKLGLRRE